MSTKFLVRLQDVGVNRDDRWLVRGVSFDISSGEIVTLIGPNGSGKSTTAKLALGITKPDSGNVQKCSGLRVGYVPQRMALDWSLPLTVRRFMHLTNKLSEKERHDAMVLMNVLHLENAEVRNLSGGELQRILLARAIARKPELLVLDEPVQGVDFKGEVEIYDLIGKIKDQLNCGILLISHDLHVVMAATDRVICLNGHVCCEGTPKAVAASDEYIRLFGDRASPTIAFYEHKHDHTHLPDGTVQHADGSITEHCHPDDGHHDHEHNSMEEHKGLDHVG